LEQRRVWVKDSDVVNDSAERRVNELEGKVTVLTRLMEVSTQLNSTLQLDDLLRYIMDAAAEITASEAASVLLWNNNSRQLFFAATTTDSPLDLIGKSVPLEGSIAGTIMRERRVVQVDNAEDDPRHYDQLEQDNQEGFVTKSLLGVPMTVKNRLIGVLEVINKRNLPWTEDDRHYLGALAVQAAVAIESAQLVRELKHANEELSQLDKLKSDFIAIASHELRTPLGVILGYASFLQEETSNTPEASAHATKVMDSALHLRKIIEDLTNLRYLQQNSLDLDMQPLSVDQLLKDVRFDVMPLLEAKGQRLQILPVDPSLYVRVDRARISMAITNMLANAVEFTPNNDRILIEVSTPHQDEVWIQIKDNGIGIEADQLERIFEQFIQVENHMVRRHGGLGIGLSISKALVTSHGGRVWAESPGLEQGSTFTVSLPLLPNDV
jgi:signal transduction histidine kinase